MANRSDASKARQRAWIQEYNRERRKDPEYREKERQQAAAYNQTRDREKENARRREKLATDPQHRERIHQGVQRYRAAEPIERTERRRAYMRAYNANPENRARIYARRRERYAADTGYREALRVRRSSPEYRAYYRAYMQQRHYGMDVGEFDRMFKAQGGVCKICGKAEKLFVDHCHITGAARGLLCPNCNTGIGMLGDNLEAIESALRYLKEAEQQ